MKLKESILLVVGPLSFVLVLVLMMIWSTNDTTSIFVFTSTYIFLLGWLFPFAIKRVFKTRKMGKLDKKLLNLIISGIFLISVVLFAGAKGWTHVNMPIIQIPVIIGLFWFLGSWMLVILESMRED